MASLMQLLVIFLKTPPYFHFFFIRHHPPPPISFFLLLQIWYLFKECFVNILVQISPVVVAAQRAYRKDQQVYSSGELNSYWQNYLMGILHHSAFNNICPSEAKTVNCVGTSLTILLSIIFLTTKSKQVKCLSPNLL